MKNSEMIFQQLFERFCSEFGEKQGEAIIDIIVQEIGGIRVTLPDIETLYRRERNRKIKNKFNGCNHQELAIMYGISKAQVRRILMEK